MITLCVIVYIIIALCIAHSEYNDDDYFCGPSGRRHYTNENYKNKKKSLIYGFASISIVVIVVAIIIAVAMGIIIGVSYVVYWIVNNLP